MDARGVESSSSLGRDGVVSSRVGSSVGGRRVVVSSVGAGGSIVGGRAAGHRAGRWE